MELRDQLWPLCPRQRCHALGFGGAVLCGISFVVGWAYRQQLGLWARLCAGLLIGGALGNALDRVIHGAVVDFLNMSCCGINNPYAFNVADIFIFAGAIGLAFFGDPKKDG